MYFFAMVVFIFVDYDIVFKVKQKKVIFIYCFVTVSTLSVLLMNHYGVDIPSPFCYIKDFVTSIIPPPQK